MKCTVKWYVKGTVKWYVKCTVKWFVKCTVSVSHEGRPNCEMPPSSEKCCVQCPLN